jgi:hypothetical protein
MSILFTFGCSCLYVMSLCLDGWLCCDLITAYVFILWCPMCDISLFIHLVSYLSYVIGICVSLHMYGQLIGVWMLMFILLSCSSYYLGMGVYLLCVCMCMVTYLSYVIYCASVCISHYWYSHCWLMFLSCCYYALMLCMVMWLVLWLCLLTYLLLVHWWYGVGMVLISC